MRHLALLILSTLSTACMPEQKRADDLSASDRREKLIQDTAGSCLALVNDCEDWAPKLVENTTFKDIKNCDELQDYGARGRCWDVKAQTPQLATAPCEGKFRACIDLLGRLASSPAEVHNYHQH